MREGHTEADEGFSDYLSILSGTSQNLVGIVVAALATFGAQVLLTRAFGPEGFGVVTVVTQAAFVASFATRAGMDMTVLRDVAVNIGVGRSDLVRIPVGRAVAIAGIVSLVAALAVAAASGAVRGIFSIDSERYPWVVEAGAAGLPFLALTNVWLSATRGLKIMRYTLYVFWAGQPVMWIVLMLAGWQLSKSTAMSVLAYSLSWACAGVAAWACWRKESASWAARPMEPGRLGRMIRYAAPRAPAALFSQLLFWTDLFVLSRYVGDAERGVYAASLRAGQVLVLFLTSVNLMFGPFVADLHNRNERERLDSLFKTLTRWTLAATLPVFLVFFVTPTGVLDLFGAEFKAGQAALLILVAGQLLNVATGSVGFVLIMVGRTGWDLAVYAGSLALDLSLAFWLCPRYGMEGAAVANAVTFGFSNLLRMILVRRFVGIQPYDSSYLRLLAPATAAFAAMWLIHMMVTATWIVDLPATAVGGSLVYVAAYLAVGLTKAERRGVARLLTSLKTRTQTS
jgi:O-antigen/teichoic acid export membrane protein